MCIFNILYHHCCTSSLKVLRVSKTVSLWSAHGHLSEVWQPKYKLPAPLPSPISCEIRVTYYGHWMDISLPLYRTYANYSHRCDKLHAWRRKANSTWQIRRIATALRQVAKKFDATYCSKTSTVSVIIDVFVCQYVSSKFEVVNGMRKSSLRLRFLLNIYVTGTSEELQSVHVLDVASLTMLRQVLEILNTSFFSESIYRVPGDNNKFYGTFTTSTNGLMGSAICSFTLSDIHTAFAGKFKEQASSSSAWLPVLSSRVPEPRPGTCVNNTETLPDSVLNFIRYEF